MGPGSTWKGGSPGAASPSRFCVLSWSCHRQHVPLSPVRAIPTARVHVVGLVGIPAGTWQAGGRRQALRDWPSECSLALWGWTPCLPRRLSEAHWPQPHESSQSPRLALGQRPHLSGLWGLPS